MKAYNHPDLEEVSLTTAMQALADPARMAILRAVVESESGEIACNEISLQLSKATVSHHFETLREAGLIRTRVAGTKCLSSLRGEEFDERFPGLLELVLNESD
ncbi:winged helix-turn-helix transcriptional regulator [Ruficoccus amylovorans]|uniref:Winged helix-turn-helix transcriptional regulator n=1 Tax=Ruficoccus amylovorans TaxID=1804625 RepID=A0A842HEJ9_9BACT|nr:helix-turn-helix domain-containing protein [Ruficoccus amylovorans]MBC2593954.1 winged helix-turn-helix transcriptional regulator [Ruficoccus amylovorans]